MGQEDGSPNKEDYQQQSMKVDRRRPLRYSRKQLCVLAKLDLSRTIPSGLNRNLSRLLINVLFQKMSYHHHGWKMSIFEEKILLLRPLMVDEYKISNRPL